MTPAFLAAYGRLCLALREPQDDSGTTQQVYWDALSDLEPDTLIAAVARLARDTGRKFFPSTGEWRAAALAVRGDLARTRLALPAGRSEPWHHECEVCEDTGWAPRACQGLADGPCRRRTVHLPHPWVDPCGCRGSNRTYQRKAIGAAS